MITTVFFITFIRELEKMEKSREITERVAVETEQRDVFTKKICTFLKSIYVGGKNEKKERQVKEHNVGDDNFFVVRILFHILLSRHILLMCLGQKNDKK